MVLMDRENHTTNAEPIRSVLLIDYLYIEIFWDLFFWWDFQENFDFIEITDNTDLSSELACSAGNCDIDVDLETLKVGEES